MKFVIITLLMVLGISAQAYTLPAGREGFVCSTDRNIEVRYLTVTLNNKATSLELRDGSKELKVERKLEGENPGDPVRANGDFGLMKSLENTVLTTMVWKHSGGSFDMFAYPKTIKWDQNTKQLSFKAKANSFFVSEGFLAYGMEMSCQGKM